MAYFNEKQIIIISLNVLDWTYFIVIVDKKKFYCTIIFNNKI